MTDSTPVGAAALDAATTSDAGRERYVEVVRDAPIAEVVVHARGAIVTRRIELLGDDPSDAFLLVCPDITMQADPSSIRCELGAGRGVRAVTTRVHLPEHDTGSGPSRERLEILDRRIARLNDEHAVLTSRRNAMMQAEVQPRLGRSLREEGAAARADAALAAASLLDERITSLEARLVELETEHRTVSREREAAGLEDAQASQASRKGAGAPSRQVLLLIEAGTGTGPIDISYVVRPARWWPAYTLRVGDDGQSATLVLEANVAQDTGEDWEGVRIGLATSEIVSDAQLPRLPSYRLGRAQPDPPRAFRPPPKGVERLFAAYDLATGGPAVPAEARPPQVAQAPPAPPDTYIGPQTGAWQEEADHDEMLARLQDLAMQQSAAAPERSRRERAATPVKKRKAGAPPPPAAAMARSSGFAGAAQDMLGGAPAPLMAEEAMAFGGGGDFAAPATPVIEPTEGWLDFDSIVLAPAGSSRRGRLERRHRPSAGRRGSTDEAEAVAIKAGSVDPLSSRGHYDHRYDSRARVDVPSDGALHRVEVASAACPASLSWRTNPREDASVFREVSLDNPFPSPLLAGPIDVYVRGSLVANSELQTVDRGGTITTGLGVDERIRVARNARVREESAGLLGGKREIDHFIDIELASSLGFDAVVEVIDRIPVSRDEHVDVEMFECAPDAEPYDQSDRNVPVDGGYRWRVEVLAGDQATIRFAYRIKLKAKYELIGGNRRD